MQLLTVTCMLATTVALLPPARFVQPRRHTLLRGADEDAAKENVADEDGAAEDGAGEDGPDADGYAGKQSGDGTKHQGCRNSKNRM